MNDNLQFTELFWTKWVKSYGSFSEVTCFQNERSKRHQSGKQNCLNQRLRSHVDETLNLHEQTTGIHG